MSVKGKFMLATMVMLAAAMLIYPYASAQIATEPVCRTCFPNDCYSYKDCKPLTTQSCKTGKCCEGTCTVVPNSTDAKVNYIGDQLVELLKKTESVTGYVNKPSMIMHGTEYTVGDKAKVWLQAVDAAGKYINTASCYVSIYYPYGTTFISKAPMSLLADGIYYYDIIVPDVVGIYPAIGLCYYSTAIQEETADAGYIINGTTGGGSYTTTATKNNAYWNIDEALVNGTQRIAVGLNYTGVASLTGLTEVDFNFQGRWNGGTDVITIYFYNWTSATWQALPNTIPDTGAADLDVSNSILTNNATISGIRKDGNIYIQFRDTTGADVTSSRLRIDYMAVNLLNLSGDKATEIKGSSEIHAKANLISSSDYLDVQTTCGMIDPLGPDSCGNIVNYDDEMNYLEKEIEVNITATSLSSENDTPTSWKYQTPISQDCTSLYRLLHYNGTGWEDILSTVAMHSHKGDENCHITVPLVTNIGQVDYYRIIMDNYMLWEIQWTWAMANVTNSSLSPLCTDYALQFNYTYTVPITEDVFVNTSDNQLFGCHRFFDDLYYADYYSNLSIQATTVAELTDYYIEVIWYQTSMRHNLQFAIFNYAYNDYLIDSSMPSSVWNYTNRTLTDYNQTLMWNLMYANNQSIYNRLDSIESNIRGDISSVNESTMNYLYGIKGDLTSVLNDIQDVYNHVGDVNTSIQDRLDSISNDIDSLGTQIDNVNVSLYNKIDQMTSDLAYQLANISEISVNITGDLTEVANDVWTLFFRRGTPPLAPSTDYYCDANNTNILNKNITYEFIDDKGKVDYFSKVEQINCGFGCINGSFMESHAICDYDPTTKGIVAIIIVVIIAVVMYFAIKHTGGEEE
jgi:hypothetical protein